MASEVSLFITLWISHVWLAGIVVVPLVLLGRCRVDWRWWEALVFVLPFLAWALLMLSPIDQLKSLGNLGEVAVISGAIVVAAAVRLACGRRPDQARLSKVLVISVVIVAVATFFFMPVLPE